MPESVEEFRARARSWLPEHMPSMDSAPPLQRDSEESWARARELQRTLFEGGFAGLCFPREYSGQGLSYEHKRAFDAEIDGYEMPTLLNIPSFAICCATILDMGSEEQKRSHIAAALRGDEVLVQLLSEPGGGSDLAAVTTRAERHGDRWIINGAKTWSTGAFAADYGLCLARTDWDVPKHEGLTMFLVPIRHPGITIKRIAQINGSLEFCEEFLDDVDVGDDAVVGLPGQGWAVASRQLFHERRTMGDGSEHTIGPGIDGDNDLRIDLMQLVEDTDQTDCERVQEMVGRALVHRIARRPTQRVCLSSDDLTAGFHLRRVLLSGLSWRRATTSKPIPPSRSPARLRSWVTTRACSASGGDIWDARSPISAVAQPKWRSNVIAERVLNFPREYAADRGVPFRQVRLSKSVSSPAIPIKERSE